MTETIKTIDGIEVYQKTLIEKYTFEEWEKMTADQEKLADEFDAKAYVDNLKAEINKLKAIHSKEPK